MVRVTGRIVRFDDIRGYGFIAPDTGGDDVFLHANDLEIEKSSVGRGVRVSFGIEDGPRGKFATAVRLSLDGPVGEVRHVRDSASDSDEYYDVLSVEEFRHAVTETLLGITPAITGAQILQARAVFEAMARKNGWIE